MLARGAVVAGKYQLEYQLGEGGMGAVWRAQHIELKRSVAMKVIDARGPRAEQAIKRFLREAQAAAGVRHRNVVDIIDFGTSTDGQPYMVMEYLEGESLAHRLAREPRLTIAEFVEAMRAALSGLNAVHYMGVIHRDLKPDNIFLSEQADAVVPKLLDFGLSRIVAESGASSGSGRISAVSSGSAIVGTIEYMSPEQARGLKDVDHRTDIYSMGVILYEGLTGRPPFVRENAGDLLVAVMSEDAPAVHTLRAEIARPLSDAVGRAMSRDRERRYGTPREMSQALADALEKTPSASTLLLPKAQMPARLVSTPDVSGELLVGKSGRRSGRKSRPSGRPSSKPVPLLAFETAASSVSEPEPEPLRRPSRGRRLVAVVLLLGGAAAAAIAFASWGNRSGARAGHATPADEGAARGRDDSLDPLVTGPAGRVQPPEAAPPRENVVVHLDGVPEGAEIRLDGAHAHGTRLELPSDGRSHEIEVRSASGAAWHVSHRAVADARYLVRIEEPSEAAPEEGAPAASSEPSRSHHRRSKTRAATQTSAGTPQSSGFEQDPGF